MPVKVDIIEAGKIVLVTFSDPWKTADMLQAYDADLAHRDAYQEQHPGEKVHLIVDLSEAKLLSEGVMSARRSPSLSHPTSGNAVIVSANPLLQIVASTVFKLSHYDRAAFVKTLDEALNHIRGIEP